MEHSKLLRQVHRRVFVTLGLSVVGNFCVLVEQETLNLRVRGFVPHSQMNSL